MRTRLAQRASDLDHLLADTGLSLVGGTSLYRLIFDETAPALWEGLGRRGILVRAFADHPGWLRLGLPPDRDALDRLADALKEIRSHG